MNLAEITGGFSSYNLPETGDKKLRDWTINTRNISAEWSCRFWRLILHPEDFHHIFGDFWNLKDYLRIWRAISWDDTTSCVEIPNIVTGDNCVGEREKHNVGLVPGKDRDKVTSWGDRLVILSHHSRGGSLLLFLQLVNNKWCASDPVISYCRALRVKKNIIIDCRY